MNHHGSDRLTVVTVTLGPPARSITARTRPQWFGPEHSSQLRRADHQLFPADSTYLTELDPDLVQLPVHSFSSLLLVSLIFWLCLSFLMTLTSLLDHDTLVSRSYDMTEPESAGPIQEDQAKGPSPIIQKEEQPVQDVMVTLKQYMKITVELSRHKLGMKHNIFEPGGELWNHINKIKLIEKKSAASTFDFVDLSSFEERYPV
ncbi:hypothetical protein F2Q68_00039194 [Brassica cretica]|uniref:Uncharacterized protein n=1 Tax=Brassica cretica TaxID=69181 RepID=A0A8S9MQK6_BRACR|nr:hypothetical protein F2Q68_00039194 [Brassica cretica]